MEVHDEAHTVVIHLVHADPEFLFKLATPFASVLPADTPAKDLGLVAPPSTGPYSIQDYDPNKGLKLVRNPYFHEWNAAAQPQGYPDVIQYQFGATDEAIVTEVENGQTDYMYGPKPLDRLAELGQKYEALVHIHPMLGYYYAPMNVNLPPFNNPLARQAVAYALDRRALVSLYGGTKLASVLCQDLPEGLAGYEHDHAARAARLDLSRDGVGRAFTSTSSACGPPAAVRGRCRRLSPR